MGKLFDMVSAGNLFKEGNSIIVYRNFLWVYFYCLYRFFCLRTWCKAAHENCNFLIIRHLLVFLLKKSTFHNFKISNLTLSFLILANSKRLTNWIANILKKEIFVSTKKGFTLTIYKLFYEFYVSEYFF